MPDTMALYLVILSSGKARMKRLRIVPFNKCNLSLSVLTKWDKHFILAASHLWAFASFICFRWEWTVGFGALIKQNGLFYTNFWNAINQTNNQLSNKYVMFFSLCVNAVWNPHSQCLNSSWVYSIFTWSTVSGTFSLDISNS